MDGDLLERLKKLEIEEVAWMVLIGIIVLSFYANEVERDYLIYKKQESREKYRHLQIFIFVVAFLIYLYYTIGGWRDIMALKPGDSQEKINHTYLSFVSSFCILVAGAILIYISLKDQDVEIELALN